MTEEQDPLDTMDIRHIRLSDGQEIIAYINAVDGATIVTERPMLVHAIQNKGYDTYWFSKFMPFAKVNLIKINSRNIISASEVRNDIKEKYLQAAVKTDIEEHDTEDDIELTDEEMDLNFMEPLSKKIH